MGCSGSESVEASPGTADEASTAPSSEGATSTTTDGTSLPGESSTASSTPATPSPPTAFTATASDAVNELKAAWEQGDRERAAAIAPGDVVDALFGVPADGFEVYGCDSGEFPTSSCNYRNRSTGAYIKVSAARSDAGWQISTVTVT